MVDERQITFPLPSIIVLKNSIAEGKIPAESDLEIGEIALNLFKDKESIWAKNSENEIIDLRKPRPDLFWEELFLKYDTLDEFKSDLGEGLINSLSIVYIKNEKLIWTDNTYFNCFYTEEELNNVILNRFLTLPEGVLNLNIDSPSEDILSVFETIDNFKRLVTKALNYDDLISAIRTKDGKVIPVSITASHSNPFYILKLEWIIDSTYRLLSIKLNDSLFSISDEETFQLSLISKIDEKQDKLISGVNIKTINGESLLGSGNLEISGTGEIESISKEEIEDLLNLN